MAYLGMYDSVIIYDVNSQIFIILAACFMHLISVLMLNLGQCLCNESSYLKNVSVVIVSISSDFHVFGQKWFIHHYYYYSVSFCSCLFGIFV